jgi:peptidoglycan/xylan/chitin deacetylase (PgdA/CDA1 family)
MTGVARRLERVPILTYHSLDASGSTISTSPALFRRQMETLRERGFQGITLGELLAAWAGGPAPWPRPLVLTFDDGLRSVSTEAAPVLRDIGFRATVFVVAGRCGGDNQWPGQAAWAPRQDLLTAADLGDLVREGWEVGAHGLTHAALPRLSPALQEDEVVRSKHVLEERVGREVTTFAYPYGSASPAVRTLVGRHYRAACSADLGTARPAGDRFWLPRIDAFYLRRPEVLRLLDTAPGRAYLAARALGRRLRQTLASH